MSQKYRILRHLQLDSTQSELKRLLQENTALEHLFTVAANTQKKGKGRGVSVWQDELGKSALFSVYVSWPNSVRESFLVNKWICHVLSTTLPRMVQYKWPNDMMVGTKKLGGMLIENRWEGGRISSSIIGIGINVKHSQDQLPRAISLEEIGLDITADEVIEEILTAMDAAVRWVNNRKLLDKRYKDVLWGRTTEYSYTTRKGEIFEAVVMGVDNAGRVLLQTKKGQMRAFDIDGIRWVDPNL
ncbi:MAG TPA: biotin--[acetyl-CoA-carboxylase] ligase [Cryomorphaceae bacterium]|nr:biotin--[acetyl-CoA-carboxylase] ligase [Cryomorphaceae bacterium]|tara:strand:- start:4368 stop:5096 length:729 start_codon:yes stop_codon:yes gene_type:complete